MNKTAKAIITSIAVFITLLENKSMASVVFGKNLCFNNGFRNCIKIAIPQGDLSTCLTESCLDCGKFGDCPVSKQWIKQNSLCPLLSGETCKNHEEIKSISEKVLAEIVKKIDQKRPHVLAIKSRCFTGKWNNNYSTTPLHIAAENNNVEQLKDLMKNGTHINARDYYQRTPLHYAAEKGSEENMRILINAGADINAEDINGETPSHQAVKNGNQGAIRILLNARANLNIQDINGETPLHYAAENDSWEIFWILFNAGADPNIKNNEGETPLQKGG